MGRGVCHLLAQAHRSVRPGLRGEPIPTRGGHSRSGLVEPGASAVSREGPFRTEWGHNGRSSGLISDRSPLANQGW